jgi:hypothetical protein
MSSRNSSENFDLRCLVREKMTEWIQQNYPNAFPTTRFATHSDVPPNQIGDQDLFQHPAQLPDRRQFQSPSD